MTEWVINVDGREYRPIPDGWFDEGVDRHTGTDVPRLFAIAVSSTVEDGQFTIRYYQPESNSIVPKTVDAVSDPTGSGYVPESLRRLDWPRSMPLDSGVDLSREPRFIEEQEFADRWHEKLRDLKLGGPKPTEGSV